MSRWRTWMCLSWMGLAAACGGDDEDEPDTTLKGTAIDCSWFQGDNCYKQALATLETCTETGIGQFSADGARCTYPTGTTITFNKRVNLNDTLSQDWDYDMVTNFGKCMSYEDTTTGLRLETRDGAFVTEQVGRGLQITCPNGQQFHMVRALDSLDCGLQNLPGRGVSRSGGLTSFSLSGGPEGDFVSAFTCAAP
jgi:hypothetical protein